jgi:hypothetical protein
MRALRERQEWKFFSVLPKADPVLAAGWWVVLVLRGALPAVFGIAMGVLVDPPGGWRQSRGPHRGMAV